MQRMIIDEMCLCAQTENEDLRNGMTDDYADFIEEFNIGNIE